MSKDVPVIILIHENRGLNNWARGMADQIAEMGYIVLAPDLLSGTASDGGGTANFKNSDQARSAIYNLSPEKVTSDLDAVFEYGKNIDSSNGKVAVIGFCWGGSQTFKYVTNNSLISAAFVCYGTGPKNEFEYSKIVLGVAHHSILVSTNIKWAALSSHYPSPHLAGPIH